MPSYVIHHVDGNKLLEKIKLRKEDQDLFLLGNLIPDSSKVFGNITDINKKREIKKNCSEQIQNEKLTTHFRRKGDTNQTIMLPYPEDFLDKYKDIIDNPTVLGYYYHLCIDKYFFKDLFNKSFEFLDENYKSCNKIKETKYARILKNNKIIPVNKLFKHDCLYDDYTIMNKLLLDYYEVEFNEEYIRSIIPRFINPGVDEVDYNNIESVIVDTLSYIEESRKRKENKLQVFDEKSVINFIDESNNKFIEDNKVLIKK